MRSKALEKHDEQEKERRHQDALNDKSCVKADKNFKNSVQLC